MARNTRSARAQRPHYKVDIDVDEGARPVTLDARSLTLPSVAIIAVVLSSISLTYFLTEERTRIDTRIDTVVGSVERLATSISQLADGLRYGVVDRYTRTDHSLFCAKAELLNKGFKCPVIEGAGLPSSASTSTSTVSSTLDSVQTEMGAIGSKLQKAKRGDE